jgi:hypothetical protein
MPTQGIGRSSNNGGGDQCGHPPVTAYLLTARRYLRLISMASVRAFIRRLEALSRPVRAAMYPIISYGVTLNIFEVP